MAKILLSLYQVKIGNTYNNLACFYDSFSQELKKCGNDVFIVNVNELKKDYFDCEIENESNVMDKINQFNPDLVISFNNQIFPGILTLDCPIAIFDADAYELFSCKKILNENISRYTMLTFCKDWIPKYIELGFDKNKIHHISPATSVMKQNVIQDKNISFIGSFFWHSFNLYDNLVENDSAREFYNLYLNFLKTHNFDSHNNGSEKLTQLMCGLEENDLHLIYDIRNITLTNILDLGLHLYGREWNQLKRAVPQLFLAFDKTIVYSLEHNQDIYNTSRIGLSVNHPQNRGEAFPWRVFDVMGSNACLLSSYSKQLIDSTKGWVDIPMFHTPQEARELCLKLLKEENYRKDLVEASQNYVEKNARWEQRFENLENIFNLKMINKDKIGQISFLHKDNASII